MVGRARRAEMGEGERGREERDGFAGEEDGVDEERGLALGKLRDDAKLVIGIGEGRGGVAVRVVVAGGAGSGRGCRVTMGVFDGVEQGVPLGAGGENRQNHDQRRARQRGKAREEQERSGATGHGGEG